MELQLFHIAGFDGDDCGVLELHVMTVVETLFTFHHFVVLLLDSGLNETTRLPNVDLAALVEDDAVRTQRQLELFLGGR
jgi:hypothetical protein